ncbi:phage GP46 family protein [Sphingomonas sp. TX0522]|uniref:phage GP46 family protein n=1 Tax=Sphingomonas sp. TX0522 TaxID=2479205 RepID=UPI0018E00B4F|nr:phage GP46 family protein [Sphingomonas sp. TX0522]
MTDVALVQSAGDALAFDLMLDAGALATDDGLRTAVTISIFTDARASAEDELPVAGGDRRGWWGDAIPAVARDVTGSKLWLLERSKITADEVIRARDYLSACLAWLVEDRVAAAVDVEVSVLRPQTLAFVVTVTRPTGERLRFDYVWNAYA